MNATVGDEIFPHSSWIKEYFTWAGFKDYNPVLRVCHEYNLFVAAFLYYGNMKLPRSIPVCLSMSIKPYQLLHGADEIVR